MSLHFWRRRTAPRGSAASDDARIACAENAIARLPDMTREVFLLHRFDDLQYDQIAQRLAIDVKEVETHIAATLVALRRALRDLD